MEASSYRYLMANFAVNPWRRVLIDNSPSWYMFVNSWQKQALVDISKGGTRDKRIPKSLKFPLLYSYKCRRTGFARLNFSTTVNSMAWWSVGNPHCSGDYAMTSLIISGQLHISRSTLFPDIGVGPVMNCWKKLSPTSSQNTLSTPWPPVLQGAGRSVGRSVDQSIMRQDTALL